MAISSNKINKENNTPYTFEVNCESCQFNDVKTGCIFANRCLYQELPEPKALNINTKCIICDNTFLRPIYCTGVICSDCISKIKKGLISNERI